ncbi:MAG: hypothetical protein FJ291_05855 [Planctomycetes bacterium]|nr:hypothetical protein [Planctomycetota bacterium]
MGLWAAVGVLGLAAQAAAGMAQGGAARFAFGPAGFAPRAGFALVTAKDAFTPEKGYGFESTQELPRGRAR